MAAGSPTLNGSMYTGLQLVGSVGRPDPFLLPDVEENGSWSGVMNVSTPGHMDTGLVNVTRIHISSHTWISLRYAVLVLYLLTFFFGLIGNSLTIFVILRNKRMKTVATCFILNLAVADDLFMFSLPFMAYSTFTRNWIFGSFLCKVMSALYGVNLYASIFTMVLMSFDRYLAIVHPLRSIRYRTVKNAVIVCVLVWLACFIVMMPYWLYARTEVVRERPEYSTCQIFWPRESLLEHMWFWINFELLIGFVLPIIIMVICYLQLLRNLVINAVPVHQDPTRRPIRKVTIMVFVVTLVFVLCWTPYHIVRYTNAQTKLANSRGGPRAEFTPQSMLRSAIFNVVAQALVFLASSCNPFIYGISSRNFRKYCWFILL